MLEWRNLRSGWPALLSLVVGFAAMVPFMDTGLVVGPVAKALDGADISFLVGFVVAALVYFPLRKVAAHPTIAATPLPGDHAGAVDLAS
jgi:purine-cytosine permease-like protein